MPANVIAFLQLSERVRQRITNTNLGYGTLPIEVLRIHLANQHALVERLRDQEPDLSAQPPFTQEMIDHQYSEARLNEGGLRVAITTIELEQVREQLQQLQQQLQQQQLPQQQLPEHVQRFQQQVQQLQERPQQLLRQARQLERQRQEQLRQLPEAALRLAKTRKITPDQKPRRPG